MERSRGNEYMKQRKISEFRPGELFFTTEAMGDEIREVYYIRTDDAVCRWPNNVRAARFAIAQGQKHYPPRYQRIASALDANAEVDGRVQAYPLEGNVSVFLGYLSDYLPSYLRSTEKV